MNAMTNSLAGSNYPQRNILEDPMNTANATSYIRRISIFFMACSLVCVFWYTGFANSLVAPASEKPAAPAYVVEALLNGDPDYAPDSIEYAIEKEFYLPHTVDLAAGSKYAPARADMHGENAPELASALSGKPTQCSVSLALNDAPDCRHMTND